MLFVDVKSYEKRENVLEISQSIRIYKFFSTSSPLELFCDAYLKFFNHQSISELIYFMIDSEDFFSSTPGNFSLIWQDLYETFVSW